MLKRDSWGPPKWSPPASPSGRWDFFFVFALAVLLVIAAVLIDGLK